MIAGVSDAFAVPDAFAVSETFALADEKETDAVDEGIADVDAAVALADTWVADGAVELTATGWKEVPFTRGSGTTSAEELVSGAYHHRVVTPTGNV